MTKSICGLDCGQCELKDTCGGCKATNGKPFGGDCMIAVCCREKEQESCSGCSDNDCGLKKQLIEEFNALGIEDMPKVTDLNALCGSYINLEYTLPGGQAIKFWDNNRIYLGNQLEKKNSNRCYGLTADETYLLVCEYGENGTDAEIVVYKKWRKAKEDKVDSRCGLHCTGCEYKVTYGCSGCIETNGNPFYGQCSVAKCCQDKGLTHCGECPDIPCELLTQYSCDSEYGDKPQGARIEQCKRWAKRCITQ